MSPNQKAPTALHTATDNLELDLAMENTWKERSVLTFEIVLNRGAGEHDALRFWTLTNPSAPVADLSRRVFYLVALIENNNVPIIMFRHKIECI